MKKLLLILALFASAQSQAADIWGSVKKYALPCVATMGASYAFMKQDQAQIGALGCSFLVIGGEMVPQDPMKDEQLAKMDQMFSHKLNQTEASLQKSFETHVAIVDQKVATEEMRTRELVKNVMTDVAIIMEQEVYKKVQAKLKELEFVPGLKQEMMDKIKEEVIAEMKGRKPEIEDAVVEKVIKRVTAEPITVQVPESQLKRNQK